MPRSGPTRLPAGRPASRAIALIGLVSLFFALAPASARAAASPEECPNAELQIEDGSSALPDCRAWELVSPPKKNDGAVQGPGANFGGDVLQAAAAGAAVTYSSSASFGPEAQGAPPASQYLSRLTPAGWQTENITAPTLSGSYGPEPEGVPYQLFSPDLDRGLMLDGRRCGPGESCPRSYSLRVEGGTSERSPEAPDLRFAGADPELLDLAFTTCAALTPQATEDPGGGGECDPADPNLYEWGGRAPRLINALPGQTLGTPGARLAAQTGAISTDGARVYWVAADGDLYLSEAGRSIPVDLSGQAEFQLASSDGAVAYFLKAGHLYSYSAATEVATDLSPAGGVTGVLGASADGSAVYYATGSAVFLWRSGVTSQVATGPADPGDYPPAVGTARVSPDGQWLAFLSSASLTGYDNADRTSGEPDTEAYLYGAAAGRLICASCNPSGEPPRGPSTIPGALANGGGAEATRSYKPRDLSLDGDRLFFDSADRLAPSDASAAEDVYEWEAAGEGSCRRPAGCDFLISSGRSAQASEFIDASADGSDVFFLTAESLLPSDPGSVDLYDAREGGGFSVPQAQVPCEGDSCQSVPSPPEDPQPGTLVSGAPNPKPIFPRPHHKKPKKQKHKAKSKGRHHHKKKPAKKKPHHSRERRAS